MDSFGQLSQRERLDDAFPLLKVSYCAFGNSGLPRKKFRRKFLCSCGSNLHQLLAKWHDPPRECCGRWTPDGRYYVFQTVPPTGDIFVLPERGILHGRGKPLQLTFGAVGFSAPVLSPDGKKMFVYASHPRGELVHYDKLAKQFVPFLDGISACHVAFSPDGKWVAYVTIPDNTLWRSRVDGSEKLQLTFAKDTGVSFPAWSPDGKQISYAFKKEGKPLRVSLIAADGSSPRPLNSGELSEADPSWSPDGSQLAFATGYHASDPGDRHISIMDMKSAKTSKVPGSDRLFNPRWSPDGRYLVALSRQKLQRLLLYDFRSQTWATLVTDDRGMAYPSWTTDGQYVQYESGVDDSGMGDQREVRRIRLGSSKPEPLFRLNDFHTFTAFWGPWSTTAPDNSVVFTRDITTQEIYALDVDFP